MKLYVLVKKDLSPGQRVVQACHAVAEFMFKYSEDPQVIEWHNSSNIMVVLGVDELQTWADKLRSIGVIHTIFHEPDLDDMNTALVACNCGLFKDLSLLS